MIPRTTLNSCAVASVRISRRSRRQNALEYVGLVFPGVRGGRPLSENTHVKLLRELGLDAVTHGFRSGFRDYAAEQTHTSHAVMEAALAHSIKDKAEAAYARSDLFEKRRSLMESWAQYLAT